MSIQDKRILKEKAQSLRIAFVEAVKTPVITKLSWSWRTKMSAKKPDDKMMTVAMAAIQDTYGYGKFGSHKKKCDICGLLFDEPNDLDVLVLTGPAQCPHCQRILELQEILKKHWCEYTDREHSDPVHERNFYPTADYETEYGVVHSEELDHYESRIEIIGRTKRVKDIIETIDQARKYLYVRVDPQMTILNSFFDSKDRFWKDGGNLGPYVKDAAVEFVAIKLKEFLGNSSKYSLGKIRNRLINDKKVIYDNHIVTEVKKFKRSGDEMRTTYPHFPIEEYLEKIDDVLDDYRKTIDAIKDYRDNVFAHIDELKHEEESRVELTYTKIRRIFNSLKIIYDGLLYSVAPDVFTNLRVEHNMWFWHLNEISAFYEEEYRKKCEKEWTELQKNLTEAPKK